MSDTVVLDGDQSIVISADGDMELLFAEAVPTLIIPADAAADLINTIDGDLDLSIPLDGQSGVVTTINSGAYPAYTGLTEITPTTETQTLGTSYRTVTEDIIINPIPSNYGLITWDGSVLTVS